MCEFTCGSVCLCVCMYATSSLSVHLLVESQKKVRVSSKLAGTKGHVAVQGCSASHLLAAGQVEVSRTLSTGSVRKNKTRSGRALGREEEEEELQGHGVFGVSVCGGLCTTSPERSPLVLSSVQCGVQGASSTKAVSTSLIQTLAALDLPVCSCRGWAHVWPSEPMPGHLSPCLEV